MLLSRPLLAVHMEVGTLSHSSQGMALGQNLLLALSTSLGRFQSILAAVSNGNIPPSCAGLARHANVPVDFEEILVR